MIGLIVFLVIVFLLAAGFAWLADQPESLLVFRVGGFEFAEDNLAIIAAIAFAVLLAIIFIWIVITMIWQTPGNIGGFFKKRRREKGWQAVAEGVIAVGSGDAGMARRAAKQSAKFLPEEPVTRLLTAQSAQMDGKSDKAREAFEAMVEQPSTKVLGLRGLYMEAEASGEGEAARHFVEQAVSAQPGLEWSGKALLAMQASEGEWDAALVTLQQNADSKMYDKKEAKRLRAVLLTAYAGALENGGDPQIAKEKALEAHRLAPELVPAATIAARVLSRVGDLRKATKVIETTWKLAPHPELMDTYTHLRSGDSGLDRLKRAQTLATIRANHPEGSIGVAKAFMDVQDWDGARSKLTSLLKAHPSERACVLMSEVEDGEFGDRGRVREWLSRAVRAPRDPAWTADGYIAEEWAAISPISGELDAFEWKVPVENLGEDEDLALEEIPEGPIELALPMATIVDDGPVIELASAANDDVVEATVEEAAEEAEVIEAEEVKPDEVKSEETISNEQSTPDEKADEAAEATDDGVAVKLEEATDADADTTNIAAEDAEMVDVEEKSASLIDPITKPPIDDPGMKKDEEPQRKRFKLF